MSGWRKAGIAVGAVVALVVFTWGLDALGYRSPDDPSLLMAGGVRIDDGRITVKVPVCRKGEVESVRVKDSPQLLGKVLWEATGPLTPEVRHGTVTLWQAADFREVSGGERPVPLPGVLQVLVSDAQGGEGVLFRPDEVAKAELPEGKYWTKDGPRTAAQIDRVRHCNR
ncbi:hypothetical protein ACWGDE_23665 [Streptomyces sp. NPDC054956]